jgi:hypothetical protein
MNNVNILVEAKKEYTNELQKILKPRIYEGFRSIYEDIINIMSKELEENKTQSSSLIKTFQKMLKEIPQWNQEVIKTEYARIEKLSNCDYFDNLIEAVFITNTKILTSVQINDNKSLNIKINIPQPSYFIHKCYMECAKEIYKNPYIFDQKNLTPKERHNNLRETLDIIDNSINNTIRNLLPIRDILKQGLTKNNENKNEKYSDVDEYIQQEEKNKINKKVKANKKADEEEVDEEEVDEEEADEEEAHEEEAHEEEGDEQEGNEEEVDDDEDEANEEFDEEADEEVDEEKKADEEKAYEEKADEKKADEEEYQDNEKADEEMNMIEVSQVNEDKSVLNKVETKEIIYNKSIPSFAKKIKNIEKIDNDNILLVDNNPFIKKIKNKYLKTKNGNIDKNISFYKKKYEENSANYNSISDNTKITVEKNPIIKDKIIKNKIMLDINSSDEENSINEIDL